MSKSAGGITLVISIKKKITTGFNNSAVKGFKPRKKANTASNIPGTDMNIVVTNGSDAGDGAIMNVPTSHHRSRVKITVKPALSMISAIVAVFTVHHTK